MEEKYWLNERCIHLIDLYKVTPNLQNPKHKDYKNRYKPQDSFNDIGQELGITKDEVEREIKNNMVSHFWREHKKMNDLEMVQIIRMFQNGSRLKVLHF